MISDLSFEVSELEQLVGKACDALDPAFTWINARQDAIASVAVTILSVVGAAKDPRPAMAIALGTFVVSVIREMACFPGQEKMQHLFHQVHLTEKNYTLFSLVAFGIVSNRLGLLPFVGYLGVCVGAALGKILAQQGSAVVKENTDGHMQEIEHSEGSERDLQESTLQQ